MNTRRPGRPARVPTSRPRRVAGQSRAPEVESVQPDQPDPVPPGPSLIKADPPVTPGPGSAGKFVTLVVAIALLLALGAAELVYLGSDPEPDHLRPTAARPVQLSDLDVRRVVEKAATAAQLILAASTEDYDAEVDKAAATMTDTFATKFRETKAEVKDQFVAAQTHVDIDISAEGVVSASDVEVRVLLFLTQTTRKGKTGGVTPVQYRVTVTMVDTSKGWLVSQLDAL